MRRLCFLPTGMSRLSATDICQNFRPPEICAPPSVNASCTRTVVASLTEKDSDSCHEYWTRISLRYFFLNEPTSDTRTMLVKPSRL